MSDAPPTAGPAVPDAGASTDEVPPTRARILAAMDRLLAGDSPFRSLTYVSLAKEAGVGRATLNRMPDLKRVWEDRVRMAGEDTATAQHPTLRIRQLERQLRDEREAHRKLQEAHRTMARQYQHAVLLLARSREAPAPGSTVSVTPLDPSRGGRGGAAKGPAGARR